MNLIMKFCRKFFGKKKSSENSTEAVEETGMTNHRNENPEPHIESLPEQSNVIHQDGNGIVQPKAEANEPVTGGKNGRGAWKAKDHATQICGCSAITMCTTRSEDKPKSMAVAVAEPAIKSPKVEKGKARGVTISEPSARITRSKARAILSDPLRRGAKAENPVDISEPSTSSNKVDKGKAKVKVTISEPSKRKAHVGVTISEPLKSTAAQNGKAKGVTISEPKTTTNAARQEVGKGKKVDTSQRKTTLSIPKPSQTKENRTAQSPIHHIVWDGPKEENEMPRQACPLCERDLSSRGPWAEEGQDDGEYDLYFQQMNLPEVGILACGHAFHARCLESITPEEQLTDPPCFCCLSGIS